MDSALPPYLRTLIRIHALVTAHVRLVGGASDGRQGGLVGCTTVWWREWQRVTTKACGSAARRHAVTYPPSTSLTDGVAHPKRTFFWNLRTAVTSSSLIILSTAVCSACISAAIFTSLSAMWKNIVFENHFPAVFPSKNNLVAMRIAALILFLLLVGAAVADDAVADDAAAPGEGEEPHYVDGQHNPK